MTKTFLDKYGLSYNCREDFLKAMDRLKQLKVDIFLGNHVPQSRTVEKYQQLLAGAPDAFVDPTGWGEYAEQCKKNLYALIEKENAPE